MKNIFEIYKDIRWTEECDFVKIFVEYEGRRLSLIELLKMWETPFVKPTPESELFQVGHNGKVYRVKPLLPGQYHWNTAFAIYRELVLKPNFHAPYRTVLECTCLNQGCWPFCVFTKETKNQVKWTKYLQPHRNQKSLAGFWDYSIYPPLVFDKQQYYDELQPMKPIYEEWAKRQAEWNATHPSMTVGEACKLSKNEILTILQTRFSEIPKKIENTISNIPSSIVLDKLVSHAKTCQSLDEFSEILRNGVIFRNYHEK